MREAGSFHPVSPDCFSPHRLPLEVWSLRFRALYAKGTICSPSFDDSTDERNGD